MEDQEGNLEIFNQLALENREVLSDGNNETADFPNQEILAETSLTPSSSSAAATNSSGRKSLKLRKELERGIGHNNWNGSVSSGNLRSADVGDAVAPYNFPTIRERNSAMLFEKLLADCWFLVGIPGSNKQERIPAHSYVLSISSSVFYAMFHGGFPHEKDITVPDVDPVAFKILLKYIYTDEIDLQPETVLAVLYVAKKYFITHLQQACIHYLDASLNARNVCALLAQSRLFEPDLVERCWEVIDAQAELALMSDGFQEIDYHTLECILKRDTLNVREPIVFKAALKWAEAECHRQNIETLPANKRSALGNVFSLIRVPTMKIEEFANGPAQSGILTPAETTDIFLFFTAKERPVVPCNFVARPRMGLQMQRCARFQSSAYRSNQWRYRGRCDSIQFSVDRRIFVVGLGLYGSSIGAAEYKVTIELKRHGQRLDRVDSSSFFSDGSSSVFPVYFAQPIQIEPETWYTASAILDGTELSYFGQEGMPEVQCGRVTFQFQCSTESTNGTGVQGGQIPEILFFG